MSTAGDNAAAAGSGPVPSAKRRPSLHRVLKALLLALTIALGVGVGSVLAVIIGLLTGIIPFLC